MRTTATAVVAANGRLRSVFSGPPLTIRRVSQEDPAVCRLCLVNSAAGPLAGDEVAFELTVATGARAEIVSAGASIAQGRAGRQTAREHTDETAPAFLGQLRSTVFVAEGAHLDARPAPMIVCAGANVSVTIEISLAASATLRWQECLVLGRFGEAGGSVRMTWNVTRAGRAVLRQTVDLADPRQCSWPGMLFRHRVLLTTLMSEAGYDARTQVADPTAVIQKIDADTVLATVLDDDAASATRRMSALLQQHYDRPVELALGPPHHQGC